MARSASAIQAEITILEAHLQSTSSLIASTGADATSVSYANRNELRKQLDDLYAQLGRANGTSPLLVRGRLRGMR